MEIWKFIKGFKSRYGRYRVSNLGRLKGGRGNEFYLRPSKKGYLNCRMIREVDGKEISMQMHRVVAITFIPNPDNLPQVNHKNGIKSDNRISNLQWATNASNMAHAHANGLRPDYKAIYSAKPVKGKYKLSNEQIIQIRNAEINKQLTRLSVAEKYNITLGMVKDIRSGKCYPYIQ